MDEFIDPDFIETTLEVFRPIDGGVDVLRGLAASIGYSTESGPEEIGSVRGWVGWWIDDEDLRDAADAISADAEQLGAAAAAIIEAHPENFIDTVVLVDRMHLAPQWRGNRLSGVRAGGWRPGNARTLGAARLASLPGSGKTANLSNSCQ